MIKIMTIWVMAVVYLSGCKKSCLNNHINMAFIGFMPGDIDTVVLRAYKPGDNYLHLVDTNLVIRYGAIYTVAGDTTTVEINDSNPDHSINSDYDWQIYIPSKKRTISISNIVNIQRDGVGRSCLNPIRSFVLDGQMISPGGNAPDQIPPGGYAAYIRN